MGRSARLRELVLGALVAFLLGYAWLFSAVSVPNERTRLYLAMAIVDEGTLQVDGPMSRHGRVYDLAEFDGRHYTDKAPGSSFLAVPVVAAARLIHGDALNIGTLVNLVRTWLMLPVALLGFLLLRRLLRALSISEPTSDVVSLGYALGTPAFHYGTAFYGHVLVATLLIATLFLLARAGCFGGVQERRLPVLFAAGASAGLLGLVEYQAIVLSVLLALPVALGPSRPRVLGVLVYALGGLPFAVALLAYNQHAFGGPFELSYHHLVGKDLQDLHGFGLAGATHPTLDSLGGLFFSRHRGLLTTSPLMGLGLVGLFRARRHVPPMLWLLACLATVYFVLIVASSSVWYGGWSFGPRLLVPIFPLLALAAAFLLDGASPGLRGVALRALFAATVLFGAAYHLLLQVTFPELPPSALRPLPDAVKVALDAGLVAPNLACKLGSLGVTSLLPVLGVASVVALFVVLCGREATRARRAGRGFGSLLLAALALYGLWSEAPSTTRAQQAKWTKLMRGWAAREQSCSGDSR